MAQQHVNSREHRRRRIRRRTFALTGRALAWVAASVWAVVGFLWCIASFAGLAGLGQCLANHNWGGALLLIPFTLIGVALAYLSVTIVRESIKAAYGVVRKRT